MNEMVLKISIFSLVYAVIFLISTWRIFVKADYKGYLALIPIYNLVILYKILGMPVRKYLLIMLIPVIGWLINHVVISLRLVRAFDKDFIWNIGLTLLPFVYYPVLAFNNSVYALGANLVKMKENNDTIMYNQFPNVESAGIPEVSVPYSTVSEVNPYVTSNEFSTGSVSVSEPVMSNEQVVSDTVVQQFEPVDLPTYDPYSSGEVVSNPVSTLEQGLNEVVDDVETISLDDDATWKDQQRVEGPVDVMRPDLPPDPLMEIVQNPVRYGPTDLNKYKECPHCHAKLAADAKTCFLCGKQID